MTQLDFTDDLDELDGLDGLDGLDDPDGTPGDDDHDWVDARAFRWHTRRLLAETGLSVGELAAYARVPARVVRRLTTPSHRPVRKLCPIYARRLAGTELDAVLTALATPVAATSARQLIGRLSAVGVPTAPLLSALGADQLTLRALLDSDPLTRDQGTVLLRQELALRALVETVAACADAEAA